MLTFLERFSEAALFLIVLYYAAIVMLLIFVISKAVHNVVKLRIKLRGIRLLRDNMSYDVFSVEGEVLSFTEKKLGRMDTRYDVIVKYTVDDVNYYKEIVLHNRGSLRVGQKMILLCDDNNHSNAVVQDGSEEEALRDIAFALAIDIGITIFTIIILVLDLVTNLA